MIYAVDYLNSRLMLYFMFRNYNKCITAPSIAGSQQIPRSAPFSCSELVRRPSCRGTNSCTKLSDTELALCKKRFSYGLRSKLGKTGRYMTKNSYDTPRNDMIIFDRHAAAAACHACTLRFNI